MGSFLLVWLWHYMSGLRSTRLFRSPGSSCHPHRRARVLLQRLMVLSVLTSAWWDEACPPMPLLMPACQPARLLIVLTPVNRVTQAMPAQKVFATFWTFATQLLQIRCLRSHACHLGHRHQGNRPTLCLRCRDTKWPTGMEVAGRRGWRACKIKDGQSLRHDFTQSHCTLLPWTFGRVIFVEKTMWSFYIGLQNQTWYILHLLST